MANNVLFGAGSFVLVDTNLSPPAPRPAAILKDVSVSFDATMKELTGAYQLPVDIARGELKAVGKAKFAQVNGSVLASVLTGGTVSTGMTVAAWNESHTIAATVVATNFSSANYGEDMGMLGPDGTFWIRDTGIGTPSLQKHYTIDPSTGTYRYSAADVTAGGTVRLNYSYTITTGNTLAWSNQLMGAGTVFEALVFNTFRSFSFGFKFFAVSVPKLSFAFKNTDYTDQDIEFAAFADAQSRGFEIYYP